MEKSFLKENASGREGRICKMRRVCYNCVYFQSHNEKFIKCGKKYLGIEKKGSFSLESNDCECLEFEPEHPLRRLGHKWETVIRGLEHLINSPIIGNSVRNSFEFLADSGTI
jgi:hypothetical protein